MDESLGKVGSEKKVTEETDKIAKMNDSISESEQSKCNGTDLTLSEARKKRKCASDRGGSPCTDNEESDISLNESVGVSEADRTLNSADGADSSTIISDSLSETSPSSSPSNVRRSTRDFASARLCRSDVRNLLEKIQSNHEDTVVLKIKNHLHADINDVVMDAIIEALSKNTVCQALYAQNLVKAVGDKQIEDIIALCSKKKIWCVNLGENYSVTSAGWNKFCRDLPVTFITHLYVSEHTINIDLKNLMRDHIRANRKKHDLHCSMKNLGVIERCTNMWW